MNSQPNRKIGATETAASLVEEWQREFSVSLKDWVAGELTRRVATAIAECREIDAPSANAS